MSREIDRKVAEALGYKVVNQHGQWMREFPEDKDGWQSWSSLKEYSTDIAAAIGALEEFHAAHPDWTWNIDLNLTGSPEKYRVVLYDWSGENPQHNSGYADTICLAICSAILSARTSAGEGE